MSNEKKLYEVEVIFKAYVLADNHAEAEEFADEIVRTEDFHRVESDTVGPFRRIEWSGWSPKSLVYHSGDGDIELRSVWSNQADRQH